MGDSPERREREWLLRMHGVCSSKGGASTTLSCARTMGLDGCTASVPTRDLGIDNLACILKASWTHCSLQKSHALLGRGLVGLAREWLAGCAARITVVYTTCVSQCARFSPRCCGQRDLHPLTASEASPAGWLAVTASPLHAIVCLT